MERRLERPGFTYMDKINIKPLIAVGGILAVAFVAWLAFGFFGIQSAFIDNEVSEGGPTFASQSSEEQQATRDSDEFQEAMDEAEENATEAAEGEPPMAGEIQTIFSGSFEDQSINGYEILGNAQVLTDGTDQRFLRFEGFNSPNGPDLKVYLRAANGEFVSLGDLKGNIGDQNYEIPPEVDLTEFSFVDIWCERFSVGFGGAQLAAV